MNYYRVWGEDIIITETPLRDRFKIYQKHTGGCIFPVYASLLGVTPMVMRYQINH
jgi:hypothetical protein